MYKLVIIEDDYLIRNGLSTLIPWDDIGFENVGCFENGKEALEYIESYPVDLLISDIRMVPMSGIDIAQRIHDSGYNIYVVFLSAYEDFSYAQKALEYDVKRYLVKSMKYDEMIDVFKDIKKIIDKTNEESPSHNLRISLDTNIDSRVKKMIDHINNNLQDVTLQSAADVLGLNPVYFSRFFKEKTQCLFSEYICTARMNRAAELIKDSKLKLYQISKLVGYNNPKNFSRAFRQFYGVSPNEYRYGK